MQALLYGKIYPALSKGKINVVGRERERCIRAIFTLVNIFKIIFLKQLPIFCPFSRSYSCHKTNNFILNNFCLGAIYYIILSLSLSLSLSNHHHLSYFYLFFFSVYVVDIFLLLVYVGLVHLLDMVSTYPSIEHDLQDHLF